MSGDWTIRRLEAPFGVEVEADFSRPLSPDLSRDLHSLLSRHQLIVARNQELTPEQHLALIKNLGNVPGTSDTVGYVSNVRPDGGLGDTEIAFHSDLAFTTHPYRAISLYGADVVDGASSTIFASGICAYRDLPAELQNRLSGLTVRHVYGANYRDRNRLETLGEGEPWAVHPLVLTHPDTGDAILYIHWNQTDRIMELDDEESEALLTSLFDVIYRPENRFEHRWHRGDLVIWDNLALQHARGDISQAGNRTLHRVVVAEKSYYELCPMKTEEVEADHARQYSTPR